MCIHCDNKENVKPICMGKDLEWKFSLLYSLCFSVFVSLVCLCICKYVFVCPCDSLCLPICVLTYVHICPCQFVCVLCLRVCPLEEEQNFHSSSIHLNLLQSHYLNWLNELGRCGLNHKYNYFIQKNRLTNMVSTQQSVD